MTDARDGAASATTTRHWLGVRGVRDPAWWNAPARRRLILGATAAVWLATVLTVVGHHEFERDEVRAFSVSIAAPSLWELPRFLRNEGHPVVWYALLRAGHWVLGTPAALPTVSVLIAAAAVFLFLFRSPFSLGLKVTFAFSALPLYEYAVSARNYGISMLLIFAYAAMYPLRSRYPWVLAVLLALLANTNVHSLPIAGVLTTLWLWDELVADRRTPSARRLGVLGLAVALVVAAAILSIKTTWPDHRTVVTRALSARGLGDYLAPFVKLAARPWSTMGEVIPLPFWFASSAPWRVLQSVLIGSLMAGLAARARLAIGFLAAHVAIGYLFNFVYVGQLRHQGLLVIFALALYWISADAGPARGGAVVTRLHKFVLAAVLPAVLLWGSYLGLRMAWDDYRWDMSSCEALGEWLNGRPEYRDAIVLGEPDYFLEALPYYTTTRMYLARESRFGRWVSFTTESRAAMSLGELLETAQELKAREHRPVLVALGFPARLFEQNVSTEYDYRRVLTWTPTEWQRFRQSSRRVAAWWSSRKDENFDLYEIR